MLSNTARNIVEVQRNTPTRDAHGAEIAVWSTIATRYASIKSLHGRERQSARQLVAEADTRIRMRLDMAISDLSPKDRIVFGARTFDVMSAFSVNNREMDILAKESTYTGRADG